MTRARIRIKTSEIMKISTLSKNAPATDGVLSVPKNDCSRWNGLKNRSATTSLPGASATTTASTAKNSTVLALETSTARLPSIFEPRPALGVDEPAGSSLSPGPVPLVVILLLEGRDAQVLLQVLLFEFLQRPVLLHLTEDLVHAAHERVALLEEHPELLVPWILADHDRVLNLEVAQVNGRHEVGHHRVDLAALQRGLGVVGGVVDLGFLVRLYGLVDELEASGAHLRAELGVLEIGDSLRLSERRILHRQHALGVVEVALGEVHGLLPLGGNGDLVDVEVVVLGSRSVGFVERLHHPLDGQVHPLGDLVRHLPLEARVVLRISLEPRRIGGLVRGDGQNTLLVEWRVLDVARLPRTSLRRPSRALPAAADQQQARDEKTDQCRSLHDAPIQDLRLQRDSNPIRSQV